MGEPLPKVTKLIAASLIVLALSSSCGGGGYQSPAPTAPSPPVASPPPPPPAGDPPPATTATVTISASGVTPATVTIASGGTVTFVNNDGTFHQMASDPHPVHTDCPALDSNVLFPGQSATTRALTAARACGFHDHLNPGSIALIGQVTVR